MFNKENFSPRSVGNDNTNIKLPNSTSTKIIKIQSKKQIAIAGKKKNLWSAQPCFFPLKSAAFFFCLVSGLSKY